MSKKNNETLRSSVQAARKPEAEVTQNVTKTVYEAPKGFTGENRNRSRRKWPGPRSGPGSWQGQAEDLVEQEVMKPSNRIDKLQKDTMRSYCSLGLGYTEIGKTHGTLRGYCPLLHARYRRSSREDERLPGEPDTSIDVSAEEER